MPQINVLRKQNLHRAIFKLQYRYVLRCPFIIIIFLVVASLSTAQCPEKGTVEKRIRYNEYSNYFSQPFLTELVGYLDKIRDCPYKGDLVHARLVKRIAKLYYLNADYLNAIKYYRQSISILAGNETNPPVNLTDLTSIYYWLSMSYEALNIVSEKMIALDSCYTVAVRIHHIDEACLEAFYTWGEYLFDLGDYHRCIDYMHRCESLAKGHADVVAQNNREHFISSSLLWQVKALLELEDYQRAEKILTDRIEECKNAGRSNLGTIFSQFAELQMRKGSYEQALNFYNKSLKSDRKISYDFNCKQTWKDIGYNIYFSHYNNPDLALKCYKKAMTFINKDKLLKDEDIFESLSVYGNIAIAYVRKSNYDFAFKYFQLAFDQIKPGMNEDQILRIPQEELKKYKKIHYLTRMEIDKADAFHSLYKSNRQPDALQKAIAVYKKTDRLLDRIKTEQTELESKLFWRSDSRRLYEHAIDACYLKGDIDNAFYFFEKSRAVLLQDQLNEQKWMGERDIIKQAQLSKKIVLLDKQLDTVNKTSKRFSELQDTLFGTKQEFENVRNLIKTNNPLYFQNFINRDSITINDVRGKILNDHQAIVELFAGDSAVYVLAVTKENSYLQKINKTAFDNLSTAYVRYLSDESLINREISSFLDISYQLYQLIFRNLNLPPGRIIISPYGRYFPFESLVTSKQPVSYFVDNFAVSYTYSARYLLNNFSASSSSASGTFFGVAPVTFAKGFAPLSGSDQSLHRIQTFFRNAANFVGANATKNNFLKEYYRYRIVQLYAHAKDSGSSGDPEIYFADSTLSLSDLFYENKPASSLIVLSACETAKGKLYNGEGVFSFNRQFAALGIPSCVSTLWKANNQSTYSITELFYKYLAKGEPIDVALQSAKKEFMHSSSREHKLPFYWAAPILVGQSGTIELQRKFPWLWATAAAVLALVVTGAWQVRRRKTKKNKTPGELVLQS